MFCVSVSRDENARLKKFSLILTNLRTYFHRFRERARQKIIQVGESLKIFLKKNPLTMHVNYCIKYFFCIYSTWLRKMYLSVLTMMVIGTSNNRKIKFFYPSVCICNTLCQGQSFHSPLPWASCIHGERTRCSFDTYEHQWQYLHKRHTSVVL